LTLGAHARSGALTSQASLERQLADARENLLLIEERKSQYVREVDIDLQLVREERRLRDRIADLESRLAGAREPNDL
jgi:hypothetical protein